MAVIVSPALVIPDSELSLTFIRASGPGGQNVNKVASAVQLRFHVAGSRVLSEPVKARLRALSGRRLSAADELIIVARNHRAQEHNRRAAEERLAELVRRALVVPKTRKATRVPRAAHERRLDHKARQRRTKRLRSTPGWHD